MFTKTGRKTSAKPNTLVVEQNGFKIYITGISSCGFLHDLCRDDLCSCLGIRNIYVFHDIRSTTEGNLAKHCERM